MDCSTPSPTSVWVFGNQPLPQTLALAPILRRLVERALSLEQEDEGLARFIEELLAMERTLVQRGPGDPTPRIGPDPRPDQRVYLDHGRDIGKYNPSFPEYEIRVEGERASGTVSFPLIFEGPPGYCPRGVLGRVLRLRHPTPQLRLRHGRQDHGPAHGVPTPYSATPDAAVRDRKGVGRPPHHLNGLDRTRRLGSLPSDHGGRSRRPVPPSRGLTPPEPTVSLRCRRR